MKIQASSLGCTFLVISALESLATTPPPRSRQEMERRRDARLAAQRLAREGGVGSTAMSTKHSAADYRMPSQMIQASRLSSQNDGSGGSTAPIASSGMPRRVVVKIAGKPIASKDVETSSSAEAASASMTSLDSTFHPPSDSSDSQMLSPPRKVRKKQPIKSMKEILSNKKQLIPTMPQTRFRPDKGLPLPQQNKNYFAKVWQEQNLGTHMPAHVLADSIKMMSAAGLDPQAAKVFASRKLKDAPTQAYRDDFTFRSRQWTTPIMNAKKALLAENANFESLDQRLQLERLYQKARKNLESNRLALARAKVAAGLSKKEPLYGQKKKNLEERNALVEEVGVAFRKHLASKKMDFDSMTPEQLEVQSRKLKHSGVSLANYPKYLSEYIGKHRTEEELRRYRAERVNYNTKNSNKTRKGNRAAASGR